MSEMKENEHATVIKIKANEDIARRFTDLGLIENTKIRCVGKAPLGDPKAYLIRGCVIAIRKNDCAGIIVE